MSKSSEALASRQIVESIRLAFPEQASLIDDALRADGFAADAHHTWLERFSQMTTDAIRTRDFDLATRHLALISRLLADGDEATRKCIDVAYVEGLMWDIKSDSLKAEGWRIIPSNVKALYFALWGEKPFMKAGR